MPATSAPLPVIVNRSGGSASRAGAALSAQIEAAFAAAGQPIELELVEGSDIEAALDRHAGSPRLVIGGGDGTVRAAAQVLSERGGELAILPLGTRNHFVRQLGIPLDLEHAAALAASGRGRPVDLGDAHGDVFVNNASAGAYVDLVHERERSRLPGAAALAYGAIRALVRLRARTFDLTLDGEHRTVTTPLLFVGNNRYEVPEGKPAERISLDDGLLSVYAVSPLSRIALVAAALRVLAGRPRMGRDFVLDRTVRKVVVGGAGEIAITFDGEACRMPLPLTLRIKPRALAVVQPEHING